MQKPVIAIDRGASFTDFAVIQDEQFIDHTSIETRSWKDILTALSQIQNRHNTDQLVFTGAASQMPANIQKQIVEIPEIEAIGFGGATLAKYETCLVISMGTGTAMVHFDKNKAAHVGGTGVGGGTVKGLAALICNIDDPAVLEKLALSGKAAHLNMTIGDLGLDDLSFLPADATVGNFANIKSDRIEDKAAAILSLVAETIGIIASLCARAINCQDRIVAVGKVSTNRHIRHTLERVGSLYQTRFIYPEHPECATAFGAAIRHLKGQ
jgi:type II pantothenate kinase